MTSNDPKVTKKLRDCHAAFVDCICGALSKAKIVYLVVEDGDPRLGSGSICSAKGDSRPPTESWALALIAESS